MRERGDFDCLHEPFLHYYYLERTDKYLPHFHTEEDHPTSYADTRDMILQRAELAPVFCKDQSFYVMPELLEDVDFCQRVHHCFLIRNPMRSIMSYYKLDKLVTLDEIGLEAQWQHFDGLRKLGIDNCVVLEAEAVQADAAKGMRRFWQALDLDYSEQALSWERDSTPQDWQYVQGWHQSVSDSQGIRQSSPQEPEQGKLKFEKLCEQAPHLRDFLQHHLVYYHRLKAHSISRTENHN